MSLATRGHGTGLIATMGFGKKFSELLKAYLIFKSYITISSVLEDIVVLSEEESLYVR